MWGFNTILVVVDRSFKLGHFMTICHPITTKGVARIFIRETVRLHGFPSTIVLDKDRIFIIIF